MTDHPLFAQLHLAWRNVFRQASRSIVTLAAISIGVAALIVAGGFVEDIFVQLGESVIRSQTGHMQVTREGFRTGKNLKPEAYLIEHPDTLKAKIAERPEVARVLARLTFSGMLNNGKRDLGIIGEGIEPDGEAGMDAYLRYAEGRPLSRQDIDGVVIGQGVARSLALNVGDRITLVISLAQGAVNTLDFEVVGIFQSFSKEFDARAVRIPLEAARTLMDTPGAHLLVVNLHQTAQTDATLAALRQQLAPEHFDVDGWKTLSDFYEKTVDLYGRQFGVLRLIILLMVLLSVTNSINMTLFERTREFGTLLAVGNRPGTVLRLILLENLLLGLIGAGLGMLLGCGAALLISAVGIPMPPPPNANLGYTAIIRLTVSEVAMAGGIGFIATCLAAILPARRASRLNVVDALRQGI